jgi:hypothetical protein
MRRIALLLICLMPAILHAQDRTVTEDATFWKSMRPDQKTTYIMGFVNGYGSGELWVRAALQINQIKEPQSAVAAADKYDGTGITFGTLVDGVDKCYSDFRNSRVDVSMCVVWTIDGIEGENDVSRESFLADVRKSAQ